MTRNKASAAEWKISKARESCRFECFFCMDVSFTAPTKCMFSSVSTLNSVGVWPLSSPSLPGPMQFFWDPFESNLGEGCLFAVLPCQVEGLVCMEGGGGDAPVSITHGHSPKVIAKDPPLCHSLREWGPFSDTPPPKGFKASTAPLSG